MMEEEINLKPISIKEVGRAHLACLRCRTQKMKCSGDHPKCLNCKGTNRECKYPVRDRKVTLLESQFTRIQTRLKYLENELKKYKKQEAQNRDSGIVEGQNGDIKIRNMKANSGVEKREIALKSEESDPEEYIDPFESEIVENNYFGTASCQVFDSSLNSFLFKVTNEEAEAEYPNQQSRHFFQDPSINLPFSGVVMLPDKTYAMFLIKKVINFLGHEYYLFDPHGFIKQVDETYETLRDKKPLWLCYFLITVAIGEQYLNESPDGGIPGIRFFIPAMQLYRSYYETPTLEFVQTLLLLGFYQQGLNRTNAAYSYYGLAVRNALILGLHRKVTDPKMSAKEKEKRKRVWWTVFVMDSIWSAKLGQPIHVNFEDIDVELPENNVVPLNDSFNSELLGYNVKLGVILGNVMKEIYRPRKRRGINLKNILWCLDQLDKFQQTLPMHIKHSLFISDNRSTANLYLRLNQIVIITARPLLLSIFKGKYEENEITKKVSNKCMTAAKTTIDILVNLKSNGWFSTFGFWDAQYCFSSILILTMSRISGTSFPELEVGRNINSYMKEAGNFTAEDNDLRIQELDDLMQRISLKQDQADAAMSESSSSESSDKPLDQEQLPNLLISVSKGDNKVKLQEDNLEYTVDEINKLYGSGSVSDNNNTNTLLHEISNNFSTKSEYFPSRHSSFDGGNMSTWEPNTTTTDNNNNSHQNDVLSRFRNDLSPETWVSLTSNLQFWDSSNFPISSNDLFSDRRGSHGSDSVDR